MRHTRPFHCTDPRCFLSFGSKNDWLRHEDAVHRLPDSYLCTRPRSDGSKAACNTYFDMQWLFHQHLAGPKHYVPDAEIGAVMDDMRLGKDGEARFWCGHCRAVVVNDELGEKAWRTRCKHVGEHVNEAQKCRSQDWVCVFMQKEKSRITPQERRDLKDMKLRPGWDESYNHEKAFQHQLAQEAANMRASRRYLVKDNLLQT